MLSGLSSRWATSARWLLARHPRRFLVLYGLLCAVVLGVVASPLPYVAELQASDLAILVRLSRAIEVPAESTALVVVGIDEAAGEVAARTLRRGRPLRWPFPQEVLARAVDCLVAAGARAIVLDCLFRDPGLLDVPPGGPLARAIERAGRVILPVRGRARPGALPGVMASGPGEIAAVDGLHQLIRLRGLRGPRTPGGGRGEEEAVPSWDMAVLAAAMPGGASAVRAPGGWLRADPRRVGCVPVVSLGAVLAGSADRRLLAGRVALVGVTGAAWPVLPVMPDLELSEVEIHALAIATALAGTPLRRAPWPIAVALLLVTFAYTVQICYAAAQRRPVMVAKVAAILILVPLLALHWASVEIDVARPILIFLLTFPATIALRLTLRDPDGGRVAPASGPAPATAAQLAAVAGAHGTVDGISAAPGGDPVGEPGDEVMAGLVERYLGDRFQRPELLGAGGMGMVFTAFSKALNAEVALKVLNPQVARTHGALPRFFREYELGVKLSHPAFVRVFERGQAGLAYFSMERVRGRSLRELIVEQGRLPWVRVVAILREVAAALHYAHGQGVLHRDLKPENLMICDSGGLKILDLGVARLEEGAPLTLSGEVMGTLRYMAPEQIEARALDGRADIFSAGVVACEALTGRLPYSPQHLARQVERLPVPAEDLVPRPPPALVELLLECMAADPDRRPASFALVMARLDDLGEAGGSRPEAPAATP
jgi:CHASE2 domain-containing sensor protein